MITISSKVYIGIFYFKYQRKNKDEILPFQKQSKK